MRRIGSRGLDPGKFRLPLDIAVSADEHIFVVDNSGRLQKFSFSSTYLASYNITSYGVAVHPTSGKVYFTLTALNISLVPRLHPLSLGTRLTEYSITVLNPDLTLSHFFGGKDQSCLLNHVA